MANWKDLLSTFNMVTESASQEEEGNLPQHYPNGNQRLKVPEESQTFDSETGIIYSDSYELSRKFLIPQNDIIEVVRKFIRESNVIGNKWVFLDFSMHPDYFNPRFDKSWASYYRFLYDSCDRNGWHTNISTPLMIVGGNDVIAVPQQVFLIDFFDLRTEIDMLYCFPYGFDLFQEFSHLVKISNGNVEMYEKLTAHARFNISRIPLPDNALKGTMSLDDTLRFYFDKVIRQSHNMGMSSVCVSSANQFETATQEMAGGLPIITLRHKETANSTEGVYISPYTDVRKGKDIENLDRIYLEDINNSDLLLFNCHGDDREEYSLYYGIDGESNICYTAYDTHIPNMGSVNKVIASCACYGARYMQFSKDYSILLSSIYGSPVLNFAGSSTIAWGGSDGKQGRYSEVFIRLFIDYMGNGLCVGEAFLRAKIAYLLCSRDDDFELIRHTISEFNLFGDPSCIYKMSGNWGSTNMVLPINFSSRNSILAKTGNSNISMPVLDDVYESVRASVDSAMDEIERMFRDNLQKSLSLNNLNFKGAKRRSIQGNTEYKFYYSYNCGHVGYVIGVSDKNGNCKDIIISK